MANLINLGENIIRFIEDKDFRENLNKAQEFVRTKWTSENVAKQYLKIISDDVPHNWYIDPKNTSLVYGWGLNEPQRNEMVNRILFCAGKEALMLQDKPEYQDKLIQSVNNDICQ